MDAIAYAEWLERLVARLSQDDRVIGAVGLGTTAGTDREPDRWSGHDLWVVVRPGFEEELRIDPSWLPDHERLVMWMRETEHGMKAVYEDGHLVTASVFRPEELRLARVDAHRVLLDKGGVAAALPEVRAATQEHLATGRRSEGFLVGQFVTALLVGLGRHARGERISGHESVKTHAVAHLLSLLPRVLEPADPTAVDDLDPWRRVEQAFPEMAERIAAALLEDTPSCALGLLAAAETLSPGLESWPTGVAQAVRRLASELL